MQLVALWQQRQACGAGSGWGAAGSLHPHACRLPAGSSAPASAGGSSGCLGRISRSQLPAAVLAEAGASTCMASGALQHHQSGGKRPSLQECSSPDGAALRQQGVQAQLHCSLAARTLCTATAPSMCWQQCFTGAAAGACGSSL